MTDKAKWAWLTVLGLGVWGGSGCLLRTERISVAPDGRVTISVEYKGELEDFDTVDALPSPDSGWSVFMTANPDEDNEHTLSTSRVFEAGAALPETFSAPNDPHAGEVLHFPTALEIDQRDGATYYTFRRTYPPRAWAYTRYWEKRILESDRMQELGKKDEAELTDATRFEVIKAFALAEAHKQIAFARAAREEANTPISDAGWLKARAALLEAYNDASIRQVMLACDVAEERARQACLETQGQVAIKAAYDVFLTTLTNAGELTVPQRERFARAYATAKTLHAVTEDVGGHYFDIMVELPGEIVAHNAEEVEQGNNGSAQHFRWQFNGEAFRDRPHELIAMSKVSNAKARKHVEGN